MPVKTDLEVAQAGLLIIDMQNAFCHAHGSLAQAGANVNAMRAIIPAVKQLIEVCRGARIPIIWTFMEQYPQDARRRSRTVPAHLASARGHAVCLKNSMDAEMVTELQDSLVDGDHVVRKQEYSAFYNTNLEVLLRILGISQLVMSGVSSNVCVESTVRDAFYRGFEVVVIEDAIAGSFPDLHAATLKSTRLYFGSTMTLKDLGALVAATNGGSR
jgi:ureidoacrylate peracid hydrolase